MAQCGILPDNVSSTTHSTTVADRGSQRLAFMDHIKAASAVSLSWVLIVHGQGRILVVSVLTQLSERVMCLNITSGVGHALHLFDRTTLLHAMM